MLIAAIVVVCYLALITIVAWFFVHPFRTPIFLSPGFMGTSQESVEIPTDGRPLRGWLVPFDDPEAVIICSHGYMMNRSELCPFAVQFPDRRFAFLFFDFPAHGASPGRKSGFGRHESKSVIAAAQFAKAKYPSAKIVLVGSSMGAAASAFACAEDPTVADVLILDSAYDRLSDAVDGWWLFVSGRWLQILMKPAGYLGGPMAGVKPHRTYVSDALKTVLIPTLIIHGGADTLAPPKAAQANFDALRSPKKLVWFEGRNHSEARWEEPDRYFSEVRKFIYEFVPEKE